MMIFLLQNGCSPLMIASDEGHLDVVKTLLEAGANVNHTNKVGIQGRIQDFRKGGVVNE